ncbi:conserved hypothetical protein [delta proteobacterium NaphS2]|nr:conserved hypothetical protein [delta proteobacterium NaphS2]
MKRISFRVGQGTGSVWAKNSSKSVVPIEIAVGIRQIYRIFQLDKLSIPF